MPEQAIIRECAFPRRCPSLLQPTGGQPNEYSLVIAGVFLTVVPLAILFLALQRFWRVDLLSGGIKS